MKTEMSTAEHCRELVVAADELRFRDPGRALVRAREACEAAAGCEPQAAKSADWLKLQAEAWAVLASAYRAVGDFQHAENAINLAISFLQAVPPNAVLKDAAPKDAASRETVGPTVWARLAQRASYLRCSQKRFSEALALSQDALLIYEQAEDSLAAGSAWVDRALIFARSGDPETAIDLLERCLPQLDERQDPRSYLAAVHNMAYYRLRVATTPSEEQEGLRWLEQARRLHQERPEPHGLLQLQAVAAVAAIRFGRRDQGVQELWRIYRGFEELQALPEQMLALLHLADCAVAENDDDEVMRIAGLLFPLLSKTRLPEVARAALLRFLGAARSRSVTQDLVTRVTDELQQAVGG